MAPKYKATAHALDQGIKPDFYIKKWYGETRTIFFAFFQKNYANSFETKNLVIHLFHVKALYKFIIIEKNTWNSEN